MEPRSAPWCSPSSPNFAMEWLSPADAQPMDPWAAGLRPSSKAVRLPAPKAALSTAKCNGDSCWHLPETPASKDFETSPPSSDRISLASWRQRYAEFSENYSSTLSCLGQSPRGSARPSPWEGNGGRRRQRSTNAATGTWHDENYNAESNLPNACASTCHAQWHHGSYSKKRHLPTAATSACHPQAARGNSDVQPHSPFLLESVVEGGLASYAGSIDVLGPLSTARPKISHPQYFLCDTLHKSTDISNMVSGELSDDDAPHPKFLPPDELKSTGPSREALQMAASQEVMKCALERAGLPHGDANLTHKSLMATRSHNKFSQPTSPPPSPRPRAPLDVSLLPCTLLTTSPDCSDNEYWNDPDAAGQTPKDQQQEPEEPVPPTDPVHHHGHHGHRGHQRIHCAHVPHFAMKPRSAATQDSDASVNAPHDFVCPRPFWEEEDEAACDIWGPPRPFWEDEW